MAKFSLLLLAAPLTLAAISTPVAAQEQKKSVVVRYDDLNLASAAGRERLTARVNRALQQVCDSRPHYRQTLSERADALECEADARRDTDVKLAALFNGASARFADQGGVVVAAP